MQKNGQRAVVVWEILGNRWFVSSRTIVKISDEQITRDLFVFNFFTMLETCKFFNGLFVNLVYMQI